MAVEYGVEWDPKALNELRKLDGAMPKNLEPRCKKPGARPGFGDGDRIIYILQP